MANESIRAAFERFWMHTVAKIGEKANSSDLSSHTNNKENPHEVALSSLGVTATAAELNKMSGVTDNVQTQLDGKANSDHTHEQVTTSIILSSPNGTRFSITIGDDGILSANEIVEEDN